MQARVPTGLFFYVPEFPCNQSLLLAGPAGALEALTGCPDAAHALDAAAVICHPHPLHGGTMHNKVVHTLARAFRALGLRTLRFNFRGVGRSAGQFDHGAGESDDLRAAAEWVRRLRPQDQLWLAGFSFGAYVTLRAAAALAPAGVVLVAPAVNLHDFTALPPPGAPLIVIQGMTDEVVPPPAVLQWAAGLAPNPQLVTFEGVGHFFHQRLGDLAAALSAAVAPHLGAGAAR